MIDGVIVTPLQKIPDERGSIFHMLRNDSEVFKQFGEIYFSSAYPSVIKAWHMHNKMTLNYAVIQGMIKLVLFDDRKSSPTKGELMELFIGEDKYSLITIPNGVWNGYKCIGVDKAIIANCSTHPYEEGEMKRMDPFDNSIITYSWDIVYK